MSTSDRTPVSRRNFLRGASLGVVLPAAVAVPEQAHGHQQAPTANPKAGLSNEEMDRLHAEGVKAFVAGVETQGTGNQLLEPTLDGEVKVFALTATPVQHEVAPGERWDVLVTCDEGGVWAFHCHVLNHAESEHGMFGMVTALIVA